MNELLEIVSTLNLNGARILTAAVVAGAVVRFAKPQLSLRETAWPWASMLVAVVVVLAMVAPGISVVALLEGLVAGLVAVASHESAKGVLGGAATKLLGQSAAKKGGQS